MKKLLLFTIVVCTLFSCKKDDDPVMDMGKVTCTIDNESKTFTLLNAYSDGTLGFANDTAELVAFTLLPSTLPTTLPATYNSDTDTTVVAVYEVNNKDYSALNAGGGITMGSYELIITKNNDSKISGTFSMTVLNIKNLSDSTVITNGVFTDIPPLSK